MKKLLLFLLFIPIVSYAQQTTYLDTICYAQNNWFYVGYHLSIVTDDTTDIDYIVKSLEESVVTEKGCLTVTDELNDELNVKKTAFTLNHLVMLNKKDIRKIFKTKRPSIETINSYIKAKLDLKLYHQLEIFNSIKKWN